MSAHVIFVRFDDWTGMYVDGILRLEGHSLRDEAIAEILGATVDECPFDDDHVQKYAAEFEAMPHSLDDIGRMEYTVPETAERT